MKRTAPFSKAAIRNACIAGLFAAAPVGLFAIGTAGNANLLNECNQGNDGSCELVVSADKEKITNKEWLARKAQQLKDAEALKVAQAKAAKEAADRKAAAEAKFKAEGWFQLKPGIYGRWCTQTCSRAEVIGDATYWLMEVWAKDRSAGDIYAQINVLQNGTVVGWTNDTAYLSKGQRGVLTFSKYLPGYGSQYNAQLTKFNARG